MKITKNTVLAMLEGYAETGETFEVEYVTKDGKHRVEQCRHRDTRPGKYRDRTDSFGRAKREEHRYTFVKARRLLMLWSVKRQHEITVFYDLIIRVNNYELTH